MVNVKRVPIKIRKPIQRDFCQCYDLSVLLVDGEPGLVVGDRLSYTDMVRYLDTVEITTPIFFSTYFGNEDKIKACISRKLPVGVNTYTVLSDKVVDALAEIPHCSIHISIDLVEDFTMNPIPDSSSGAVLLREMMHLAKSRKIFLSLNIPFFPYISPRLDLLEAVDMYKNLVDNVSISFPDISDELFRSNKAMWEHYAVGCTDRLKAMYVADVPSRSWKIRDRYKQDTVSAIVTFLKSKKLPIEIIDDDVSVNRIRRVSSGFSEFPLGMRSALYSKVDGFFTRADHRSEGICKTCSKTLLL